MAETKRGPGRPPGSKNKNKTSKTNTSKAKEKAQEIQAKKRPIRESLMRYGRLLPLQ